MSRYKKRYNSRRRSGLDAALRHIEEAEALTKELGGVDQDVKEWFYTLPTAKLDKVLDSYQSEYGQKAGSYARETYADWKNKKRKMSGLVAERLFKILPSYMTIKDKYALVESLWNHVGPKKKRLIKANPQISNDEIIQAVIDEVKTLATDWQFPESMLNRFEWLSQSDTVTYQKLLSHIKKQESRLAQDILVDQIPDLKYKLEHELDQFTSRLSYVIEIGNQSVELRMSKDIQTLKVTDWHSPDIDNYKKSHDDELDISWGMVVFMIMLAYFIASSLI